ncbi:hypothetical protein SSX86_005894 [Deinandra increscens subsp. villosa]|uniref:Geranylgeranyl pyrophosphate synthase n=1 Tax=Deinandra increscens subsp. villosa TaxID=3103831 RepID=A0AAP0DRC7_9ASTR
MTALHLPLARTNFIRSSSAPPPPSASTTPVTVTQNLSYWDSIYSDINSHLKKSIPIRHPVSVFEPMHHLTFSPPKPTAAALCVAACEVVGGDRADAVVAASAIHLMHAAIYTHDHLLLTDRPGSGIPHRFGSNVELLTGDGIMPFGFELLAGSGGADSEKMLKVVVEIAQAVGGKGMVDGWSGRPSRRLDGCGAACGAILGGGSVEEIDRMKRFGVYVGKIQGLLSDESGSEGGKVELAEKWRDLALEELEYFEGKKIEQISTIVRVT